MVGGGQVRDPSGLPPQGASGRRHVQRPSPVPLVQLPNLLPIWPRLCRLMWPGFSLRIIRNQMQFLPVIQVKVFSNYHCRSY